LNLVGFLQTTKINIEIAYLSVWHNTPLWSKASILSDLVDSFERRSTATSGISDHGTRGLAAYHMGPGGFRQQVDTLLCRSTVTGVSSP